MVLFLENLSRMRLPALAVIRLLDLVLCSAGLFSLEGSCCERCWVLMVELVWENNVAENDKNNFTVQYYPGVEKNLPTITLNYM